MISFVRKSKNNTYNMKNQTKIKKVLSMIEDRSLVVAIDKTGEYTVTHVYFIFENIKYKIDSIFINDLWIEEANAILCEYYFYFKINDIKYNLLYDDTCFESPEIVMKSYYAIQSNNEKIKDLFKNKKIIEDKRNTIANTKHFWFEIESKEISFLIKDILI